MEVLNCHVQMILHENKTPLLYVEIPACNVENDKTVLFYGHGDKQPPMKESWREDLGPYDPVIKEGRLYGRGSSDDGYALYAAMIAVKSLRKFNKEHARCCVFIEFGEESGSPDLRYYLDFLRPKLKEIDLVICLDSGTVDYDRLWLTTSLRGYVDILLTVRVLTDGTHNGGASGIIPDSFRILRILLDRIENSSTGKLLPKYLYTDIPEYRINEARELSKIVPANPASFFPRYGSLCGIDDDHVELILNQSWRPTLTVTGASGFPNVENAGNVLRASSILKLNVRLPPGVDSKEAGKRLKLLLESDPPYSASVECKITEKDCGDGFDAPECPNWLTTVLNQSSSTFYGSTCGFFGCGGSIPFMADLQKIFPTAKFVVTGNGGPGTNAHAGNESMHIGYTKSLTSCIAKIINEHAKNL